MRRDCIDACPADSTARRVRAIGLLACLVLAVVPAAQASRRPNIVIIMADDLGWRDVGCYGCVDFDTPQLDALAAAGVRLTSGYVSHPYCSPSRAGLLTGRYQQGFGHEHNPPYREDDHVIGIDAATELLPLALQQHGYTTGLIGKWHVGAGPPFRPTARGFAEFYGFLGGGHHYTRVKPGGTGYDSPMWRDHAPTADTLTYLTDDLTSEAEAFIDRHREGPFCLLVMYNAPHAPDQVTDEYMARVAGIEHMGRRRYAALVQGVDSGVGRVRARLAAHGLEANTLVVFLSDNGGRRGVSDNRPLRGNKGWLHEGGVRVPFILSLPGTLPAGVVDDRPMSALDLLPTALVLGGIPIPVGVDGVDLLPYFAADRRDRMPHQTLFWRVSGGDGFAVRHERWKLVRDVGMERPALYDLVRDMGEDNDLAPEHPERVAALTALYTAWSVTLEAPRWTEGHTRNTTDERAAARRAGARQFPMPWVD